MDLPGQGQGLGIVNIASYEVAGICRRAKNSLATNPALARWLLEKWENAIKDERNS
jgi:hypothetical protein